MTAFRYRAIAPGGVVVSGMMEAADQAAVLEHLRQQGHYPVSAAPAIRTAFAKLISRVSTQPAASQRRLALATEELATLLSAGLDLDRALSILERLGDLGPLQNTIIAARARVRAGASFGEALAREPTIPKYLVSAIRAAESSGSLEQTLRQVSESLSRSLAVREAIASALTYPIILLVTAGLSVIFILTFVLPEFRPLFAEAGRALPWPARALMGLGDALRQFWWVLLMGGAAGSYAIRRSLESREFRMRFDKALLRAPKLGDLLLATDIQRFSRTLGMLLANGVALPAAVPLACEVVGNRAVAAAIASSGAGLREGDAFAARLARAGIFPAVMVDLIRVGEESGKLDDMLLRQADLDEQRLRHTVNRLLALLVPALTILLGLMVGALIASLLSAILSVNDLALPQ